MFSKKSWPLVVSLSLLLCACGSGGGEPEPAPEDAERPPQEAAAPATAEKPRYDEMSVEQLEIWVADHPDDVDGLHTLAIALHQTGKVEAALPHFEKCAALAPSERHWVELGAIYFLLGRMDDAESLFHKALEDSPRSGPALFHLGNLAQAKGDSAQAISLYSQSVEAEPNYLIAYYRLAELQRANGQATEAYAAYEAVLGCEPSGPGDLVLFDRSMLQMAALDIQHGAAERATKLLELLITEEPRHPQAHLLMAQAWNALGRAEDAQRELAIHNEIAGAAGGAPPTPVKDLESIRRQLSRTMLGSVTAFGMIEQGDRLLVALSGGKDSYTMLDLLERARRKAPVDFELVGVHLDQRQPGYDGRPLMEWLEASGVPFEILSEDTYTPVMEEAERGGSKTYCRLCSRLRRGILYGAAERLECNKIALGHHRDDALETLMMNLFYSGRLQAMPAIYTTNDGKFQVVRPLIECAESEIAEHAALAAYPILPCNLCGSQSDLKRQVVGRILTDLESRIPNLRQVMLAALKNVRPSHLLDREVAEAWGAQAEAYAPRR